MKVTKDKVVSMHYTLKNDAGDVIDSSEGKETMDFLQGHGNIIPGLETALEGSKKGDKVEVSIEPEQGYGPKRSEAIQEIPRSALHGIDELTIGMQLQAKAEDDQPMVVRVIKIEETPLLAATVSAAASMVIGNFYKILTIGNTTDTNWATVGSTSGNPVAGEVFKALAVTLAGSSTGTIAQEDKITVDANHPLAGETLHFSVSIEDVRDALEEEVSHGHAHSAGGHSH